MMTLFENWIVNATLWNATLVFLALLIVLFFLLSVFLAVYTILLRLLSIRRARRWEILESRWEQILLDILAGNKTADELHRLIQKKERLYFVDFLLRFARLLKGREIETIKDLARPYLDRIHRRLKAKDPERRARAVQTLGYLGLEEYGDELVRTLDDPSPLVALIATQSLADKNYPQYINPIIAKLHRFENWSQTYLTSILVSVGSAIVPNLRVSLADSSLNPSVRAIVCDALREMNDFASADIANSILEIPVDRELTAACLRMLARTGRPTHLKTIRALIHSEDDVIRIQAIKALGQLGDAEDRQSLANAIRDASPWVALQAARGLLETGGQAELKNIADSDHERAVLARQVLAEESR